MTCGYGAYLFKSLLMAISCEDVGLGCAEAPLFVRDQYALWRKALSDSKVKTSESYKCEEGTRCFAMEKKWLLLCVLALCLLNRGEHAVTFRFWLLMRGSI